MSAIGALSAGNTTTSVPRAMTVVGMKSSTCWNAHANTATTASCPVRPAGTPPLTPVRRSRETISGGRRGAEANCAFEPSIQRRAALGELVVGLAGARGRPTHRVGRQQRRSPGAATHVKASDLVEHGLVAGRLCARRRRGSGATSRCVGSQ